MSATLDRRRAGTYLVSGTMTDGVTVHNVPVRARNGAHAIRLFTDRVKAAGLPAPQALSARKES